MALRFREAGHSDKIAKLVGSGALARPGRAWQAVVDAAELICSGGATQRAEVPTFGSFAQEWTSGTLTRRFPDHVRQKRSSNRDEELRTEEMARLRWRDVDLEHGRLNLEKDKTDDPRDWDMRPDVVETLRRWKNRTEPHAEPDDYVFAENGVPLHVQHLAEQIRNDLRRVGVERPQLFEGSETRQRFRAHDLRATFARGPAVGGGERREPSGAEEKVDPLSAEAQSTSAI